MRSLTIGGSIPGPVAALALHRCPPPSPTTHVILPSANGKRLARVPIERPLPNGRAASPSSGRACTGHCANW
jgi:hypothetical protein